MSRMVTDADVLLYVTDVVETPDKHNDVVEKLGHLDVPVSVSYTHL